MNHRKKFVYVSKKFYKPPEQKIVHTEQIIWTAKTNMYMCQTNFTNYHNKSFVRTKQIIWTAGINIKYVYISNKFYKQP
jgi:hypothetical protein